MNSTLSKRGPDEDGFYINSHIALAHKRLIVIDPDGGKQPMIEKFSYGEYVIVYNGQIYNTKELKETLTLNGFEFKGHVLSLSKVGEPWRGLVHDLSKYSPTEFWEGVKYFNGHHSPITDCKKDKGYSDAWLHHKGRNRHHADYWVDMDAPVKYPLIPYQYVAEMMSISSFMM